MEVCGPYVKSSPTVANAVVCSTTSGFDPCFAFGHWLSFSLLCSWKLSILDPGTWVFCTMFSKRQWSAQGKWTSKTLDLLESLGSMPRMGMAWTELQTCTIHNRSPQAYPAYPHATRGKILHRAKQQVTSFRECVGLAQDWSHCFTTAEISILCGISLSCGWFSLQVVMI